MRTPMTAALSCCASMLATCGATLLLWTVVHPLFAPNMSSLGVVLPAAALIGFAAWSGIESGALLARHRQTATQGRSGPLAATLAALFISSTLLGAVFSLSFTPSLGQPVPAVLVVTALVAVSLLSGLTSTLRSRSFAVSSIIAVACCILGGAAFALGFGLQLAASYRPCPPHLSCLDPGPWFGLQVSLPVGAGVGLALGLLVWLVLGLDWAMSSPSLHPPATASA